MVYALCRAVGHFLAFLAPCPIPGGKVDAVSAILLHTLPFVTFTTPPEPRARPPSAHRAATGRGCRAGRNRDCRFVVVAVVADTHARRPAALRHPRVQALVNVRICWRHHFRPFLSSPLRISLARHDFITRSSIHG